MKATDYRTEPMPCPYCGCPNDVQTSWADEPQPPTADDTLCLCIVGACPSLLTTDGLRRLTGREMDEVMLRRDVAMTIVSVISATRAIRENVDSTPMLRFVPRTASGE